MSDRNLKILGGVMIFVLVPGALFLCLLLGASYLANMALLYFRGDLQYHSSKWED